jgi:hypothetical protein
MADLDQIVHSLEHYAAQHAEQPRQLNAALCRIKKTLKRAAPPHGAFSDFPQEILVHIFQYLRLDPDLLRVASVCTLFREATETTAQCWFQKRYGQNKSNTLTWVQSMFQARRLVHDRPKPDKYYTPAWLSQTFKCGMTLHTWEDLQFVCKVKWRDLLPHLYKQNLGNVANLFWPLASDNMLSFIDSVCAIQPILDYNRSLIRLRECLHHLELFLFDMLCNFQPTWVANTVDRTHLKSVHLGLPSLYDITQITLGTHQHAKHFPEQCKRIGAMWNSILHRLKSVDPTFFSLVMWSNVPKETGQLLAQHLPPTFFLEPFFPGKTKVGFDDLEDNLPKLFFSQPFRVTGDAGILNCVYMGQCGYVPRHWGSTLSSLYYVIPDTPLCHYEIMHIVCQLGDHDLLETAMRLGVNKRAQHPDTDAQHDSPLLTYLTHSPKGKRVYDANSTRFVATLVKDGYPCLVSTPKTWSPEHAREVTRNAWLNFMPDKTTHQQSNSKKHQDPTMPAEVLADILWLLLNNVSGFAQACNHET